MPIGVWNDSRNIRFEGRYIEKMREPVLESAFNTVPGTELGYSCAALYDAVSATPDLEGYWRCNEPEPPPGQEVLDYSGNDRSLLAGGTFDEVPLTDSADCGGASVVVQGAADLKPLGDDGFGNIYGAPWNSTTMTFGLVLRADQIDSSTLPTRYISAYQWSWYDSDTQGSLFSQFTVAFYNDGSILINVKPNPAVGDFERVVSATDLFIPTTSQLIVFTVNDTGSGLQFDVQVEGASVYTFTSADPFIKPTNWYGGMNLNVDFNINRNLHIAWCQEMFLANRVMTQTELDNILLGYQRNFLDYIPPPAPTSIGDPLWFQGWSDGLSTYVAVATASKLWFLSKGEEGDSGEWLDATRLTGDYTTNPSGKWQSFPWGDTVIFNNGVDAPQIFDPKAARFTDLPNWGMISTSQDITAGLPPSFDTNAACTVLAPVKNFLVACGVSEKGKYNPNTIWWSDATSLATFSGNSTTKEGPPSWDYESPSTLSGQLEIDPESGEIKTAALLNENLIIYTEGSATALTIVGGTFVMRARRLFQKGCAGLHCVAEFNNKHFVVATDQIFIHDGSTVQLIAKDRVESEFFKRAGKGGRFGGGSVDWSKVQVVKNPDRKELYIVYDMPQPSQEPTENPLVITGPNNTSVAAGVDAMFSVTVSGGTPPYVYVWEQNVFGTWEVIETDDTGFTGQDTSVLTYLAPAIEANGTLFRCKVTGSGNEQAYSTTATLQVT